MKWNEKQRMCKSCIILVAILKQGTQVPKLYNVKYTF